MSDANKVHFLLSPALVDCCRRALETWGPEAQLFMMIEEAGELTTALAQMRRGRLEEKDLAAEIADVIIMAMQMREMMGTELIDKQVHKKLKRLRAKLEKAGVDFTPSSEAKEAARLWGHTKDLMEK